MPDSRKRRRGILEHIDSGAIDLLESGIQDYLLLKANLLIGSPYDLVGVCFTSAPAIHAHCRRVSERTIQRCLTHLEDLGLLKTWKTPGKRGNFPVLVCRASVHDLSGNEYRINGAKTIDWRKPVYEPVGEVSGTFCQIQSSLCRVIERREKRTKRKKLVAQNRRRPIHAINHSSIMLSNLSPRSTIGNPSGEGKTITS